VPATLAPPVPVNVNVEALIVAEFIALLNVALTTAVLGQVVKLPFGGVTTVTEGGAVAQLGGVVKVHTKLAARASPITSVTPVVIVAV
jgi:hypothetical protein